jgi:hypothetical protein
VVHLQRTSGPADELTVTIPPARLRPQFGEADVRVKRAIDPKRVQSTVDYWDVVLPVSRATCTDTVDVANPLIQVRWQLRTSTVDPTAAAPQGNVSACRDVAAEWNDTEMLQLVRLWLHIPASQIDDVQNQLHLVRLSGQARVPVGTLPPLRDLLLPSSLTVQPMSNATFALRGPRAFEVSTVVLQNGGSASTFDAAVSGEFAFVDVSKAKTPLAPGTYVVLPLMKVDENRFVPIESRDAKTTLTFTIADAKKDTPGSTPTSVTKTTTVKTVEKDVKPPPK